MKKCHRRGNNTRTAVCEDGNNRLGKASNRRWKKTEEWELWQEM
jgi:hypothetical protein